MARKLLNVLKGQRVASPPIWLMRQAGRYLPEYREVRAQAKGFLDLCYTPDRAAEVTLQPIRRYGFDGAIVFSDILVIPDALGQPVGFVEGEGPKLEALDGPAAVAKLSKDRLREHLAPVYETLRTVRAALPDDATLLGFAGAPWTLACYMIDGQGGGEFPRAKRWAYASPQTFRALIDLLVEAIVDHLVAQVDAGADAVQVFDSWAGILPEEQLFRWSVQPLTRIAEGVHKVYPDVPLIVFPRGVGPGLQMYRRNPDFAALSIDTVVGAHWASRELQPHIAVQGNLDPQMLVVGGEAMEREAKRILDKLGHARHVFNLGHGVVPQTPPDNVARLVDVVRAWRAP